MSPLAVELLRRLSLLAIVLSVLLLVVPRALSELGVIGPGVEEQLSATERSLAVARVYGGGSQDPAFHAAEEALATAQRLAHEGRTWSARQAVRKASAHAITAQRTALTSRESYRLQAAAIATDIDHRLNELEDLYSSVTRAPATPGLDRALLPTMKEARRTGASVLLAIDQGEYSRAFAMQPDATAKLDGAKRELQASRIASAP